MLVKDAKVAICVMFVHVVAVTNIKLFDANRRSEMSNEKVVYLFQRKSAC